MRENGFDMVGIVRPDTVPDLQPRLAEFLEAGAHGEIDVDVRLAALQDQGNRLVIRPRAPRRGNSRLASIP